MNPQSYVLDEQSKQKILQGLSTRHLSLTHAKLLNKSDGKLTYQLTAGVQRPALILQIWLFDEDTRHKVLYGPYGIEPESGFHRLWPYGSRYVTHNIAFLQSKDIKVPAILLSDDSKQIIPYSYLVLEYISGRQLDFYREALNDVELAKLDRKIADILGRLHSIGRSWSGPTLQQYENGPRCEQLCAEQVRTNIEHSPRKSMLSVFGGRILDRMQRLADAFEPRAAYRATHGDLLPEHIVVDGHEEVWLMDVENMKFFDLEYEVCRFWLTGLELTSQAFRDTYKRRVSHEMDRKRIKFYELYWLVSWITFLEKNFRESGNKRLRDAKTRTEQILKHKLNPMAQ